MSVSAQEQATHGDMDHGLRDVDPALMIARQATPSHHPSECPLDDPSARQDLEALLPVTPPDDLDNEVEVGSLVHQAQPIVGPVGE